MNKSRVTDLDEQIEIMLSHFETVINLNEDEKEYLISFLKFKRVRKRQHILQAGDVCHYETFIIKGLLKSYFVDENDTEHIVMFGIESSWIEDGLSLSTGLPSTINIDALEDSEIFQIDKASLEELYKRIPAFERFFRIKFQRAFIAEQQRVICNFTKSAQDRYLAFLERFPSLGQRISLGQIASFLGITRQFLSHVRSLAFRSNRII
jgi:CRP-like cAMP-binding protein